MCRMTGIAVFFGLILACQAASGEVIYYHSNTANGSMTSYSTAGYPPAVLYDLPDPAKSYYVTSLSILSKGKTSNFPVNTEIKVWVWDSAGTPIYTSSAFDVSGQNAALALRTFFIYEESFTVSGSFYAGFQDVASLRFGYKSDIPAGSDYDRSYTYKVSTGAMRERDDDSMFDVGVEEVSESATPGDTNDDDIVDDSDYDNLVAQFGGPPGVESADFNADNFVDLDDFAIQRGNFGFGVGPAPATEFGATIPEPATLMLLTLGGLGVLRRRRKQ